MTASKTGIKSGIYIDQPSPPPLTTSEIEVFVSIAKAIKSVAFANRQLADAITDLSHLSIRGSTPNTTVKDCDIHMEDQVVETTNE